MSPDLRSMRWLVMEMRTGQTVVIVGAGLAGAFAALRIKRGRPEWRVRLAEREASLGTGLARMSPIPLQPPPSTESEPQPWAAVYRGEAFARQLFFRFDGLAFHETLRALGTAPVTPGEVLRFDPAAARARLIALLDEAGVEVVPGRKATEVSRGGDGIYRIWFEVGNPWEADALVLATGGGRSRVHHWAEEWGHRVRPSTPAFLSLRLSEARWRGLRGVRLPDVGLSWEDPASGTRFESRGALEWRFPFLEGPAVSALTAQAIEPLRAAGGKGRLEIAMAGVRERGLDTNALRQMVQQGGSRPVLQDPQGGLDPAFWAALASGARIGPGDTWSRLSRRQQQTLVSHLSRFQVKFAGFRQWPAEFSLQGGWDLDQIDPKAMESRLMPGLFAIGEMLDLDGAPGGTNLHLALAGAAVAAESLIAR